MLLADFALVFTLIDDVVSGGAGEASSSSSFGLIKDAGAAHVFFLSPGLACATWLGASVGGGSAGFIGDFTGGTTLDEPVVLVWPIIIYHGIQLGLPLVCHSHVHFELFSGLFHWVWPLGRWVCWFHGALHGWRSLMDNISCTIWHANIACVH